MITDINSEDRPVQQTFSGHLRDVLGWVSIYAYNAETFGPNGTLGCVFRSKTSSDSTAFRAVIPG